MNPRLTRTSVVALGLALAASGAGVAVAAGTSGTAQRDATEWYDGGNATVADPFKSATSTLTLRDASGAAVTTGSTTAPLATYVVASSDVRAGDDHASLFVHLPQLATAPGAWPGVQASGTDKYAGSGAVAAPSGVSGKPFVRTAGGYTLADVEAALPNTETSPSFAGVYELRLRTSSATAGVSDTYATTYLKVTGTTWAVTTAPVLGEEPEPVPVATSVAATWPAKIGYGTAASVPVSVTAATGTAKPTGTVRLVTGTTTLSTATLSAAGTATLSVAKTALVPGSRVLKVVYSGAPDTFATSESAPRTFAVAKAAPGRPTFKATKLPTAKKAGKATIAVPTAAGLAKATGKAVVTLKKGAATKKVTVTVAAGKGTATLPKLPAGTWTVTVAYQGSTYYLAATSGSTKIKVKAK